MLNLNERKSLNVVFDLDDVLCHLAPTFEKALREDTGITMHHTSWNTFDLPSIYGITYEEFLATMNKHAIIRNPKPDLVAIQTLNEIKSMGHKIHIITSRSNQNRAREYTLNWLNKHGVNFDELHLSGPQKSKNDFLKEIGDVYLMIDDHHENLNKAQAESLVTNLVLREQSWNHCSREKFQTVSCVSELHTFFK